MWLRWMYSVLASALVLAGFEVSAAQAAAALPDPIRLASLTVDAHLNSPSSPSQSTGSVSISQWGVDTRPLEIAVKRTDVVLLHISLSVTRAGVFFQGCMQTFDFPDPQMIYNGTDLTFTQSFQTKVGWANLETDWPWAGRKEGTLTINCSYLGSVVLPIAVTVTPSASDSELTGFTINRGMFATNSTDVLLNLSWRDKDYFDQVMMSNDGGFAPAKRGVKPLTSDIVRWRLDVQAPERMPRTVYVRFHNVLTDEWTPAVTDDIVLDTVSPVVDDAVIVDASPGAIRSDARASCVIQISASDNRTGISRIQVAASRHSGTKIAVRFSAHARVPLVASEARFVRVQDGAGNWSDWRRTLVASN